MSDPINRQNLPAPDTTHRANPLPGGSNQASSTPGRTSQAGVIELGSNTVVMVLARTRADGTMEKTYKHGTITSLGANLKKRGHLFEEESIRKTMGAITGYWETAQQARITNLHAIGTAAMRVGKNQGPIRDLLRQLQIPLRILSGEEEGLMTWLAVCNSLGIQGPGPGGTGSPSPCSCPWMVADLGGNSLELVYPANNRHTHQSPGAPSLPNSLSHPAARMGTTDRITSASAPMGASLGASTWNLESLPITSEAITRASAQLLPILHQAFSPEEPGTTPAPNQGGGPLPMAGAGGTICALQALNTGLKTYQADQVHGGELTREFLETFLHEATLPTGERSLPGWELFGKLPAPRQKMLPAGALILTTLLKYLGRESLTVSTRGVPWGYLSTILPSHRAAPEPETPR